MAFVSPVPAQEHGVRYLNMIASLIPSDLRIGGHSKGGNIAVYAAMFGDKAVQDRIIGVYSHDGPGFREGTLLSEAYQHIQSRIHKTVPQSSVVGILLQQQEEFRVVESNRYGIAQHDPFSWAVEGNDFRYAEKVSTSAIYMNKTLNQWLSTLTDEKLELFVDTLFRVIGMANASTIYEFTEDWHKRAIIMLSAVKHIDADTRKFLLQTFKALMLSSIRNLNLSLMSEKPLQSGKSEGALKVRETGVAGKEEEEVRKGGRKRKG